MEKWITKKRDIIINPAIKQTLIGLFRSVSSYGVKIDKNAYKKIDIFFNCRCWISCHDLCDLNLDTDSSSIIDFWYNDTTTLDCITGYVSISDEESLKIFLSSFESDDFKKMRITSSSNFKKTLLNQYLEMQGEEEEIKEWNNTIENSEGLFSGEYKDFVEKPLNKYARKLTNFSSKFSSLVEYRENRILSILDEYEKISNHSNNKKEIDESIVIYDLNFKKKILNLYNSVFYFFNIYEDESCL